MATKKIKKGGFGRGLIEAILGIMITAGVFVIGYIFWVTFGSPQEVIRPSGQEIVLGQLEFSENSPPKMEVFFGDAHPPITIHGSLEFLQGVYNVPEDGQESVEVKYSPITGEVVWAKFYFLESKSPD